MEITQIHVSYLETEDRVLMRLNFGVDRHVALTLTRRIARFILENIAAMPQVPVEIVAPQTPIALEEHPAQDSTARANAGAALVLNATCRRTNLEASFTFACAGSLELNLNLSLGLAKGLEKLLWPIVEQAQWFVALNAKSAVSAEQTSEDPLFFYYAAPSHTPSLIQCVSTSRLRRAMATQVGSVLFKT